MKQQKPEVQDWDCNSQKIVEEHGGNIKAYNDERQGAVIRISSANL